MSATTLHVTARRSLTRAGLAMPTLLLPLVLAGFSIADRSARRARREDGVSVVEWVIIVALVASVTVGVAVLLRQKITEKSATINLNEPGK